jgi:hypothetical protein
VLNTGDLPKRGISSERGRPSSKLLRTAHIAFYFYVLCVYFIAMQVQYNRFSDVPYIYIYIYIYTYIYIG